MLGSQRYLERYGLQQKFGASRPDSESLLVDPGIPIGAIFPRGLNKFLLLDLLSVQQY